MIIDMDSKEYKHAFLGEQRRTTQKLQSGATLEPVPDISEVENPNIWAGLKDGRARSVKKFNDALAKASKPVDYNYRNNGKGGFRQAAGQPQTLKRPLPEKPQIEWRLELQPKTAPKPEAAPVRLPTLKIDGHAPIEYDPKSDIFRAGFEAGYAETTDALSDGNRPDEIFQPEFDTGFDRNEYSGYCLGMQKAIAEYQIRKQNIANHTAARQK